SRALTVATCFMPSGLPLREAQVDAKNAARFLAALHDKGFHFRTLEARNLVADGASISILDPLQMQAVPGSASHAQRLHDLNRWLALTQYELDTELEFRAHYLAAMRRADRAGFRALLAGDGGLADNAPTP